MKTLLTGIVFAILGQFALAQDNPQAMLAAYLDVKEALVQSDGKQAAHHAVGLLEAIDAQASFFEKEALRASVQKLAKTTKIEQQRSIFTAVSVLLWKVVKGSDQLTDRVYYQYCPMKDAYWLSDTAAIQNPYYGASMLTCGKVVDQHPK